MSVSDFCSLTPKEWRSVCLRWRERRDVESRERWEQVRWLGLFALQPHVRKRLTPEDVLSYPWDVESLPSSPRMSRAEAERRMRLALERMGRKLED